MKQARNILIAGGLVWAALGMADISISAAGDLCANARQAEDQRIDSPCPCKKKAPDRPRLSDWLERQKNKTGAGPSIQTATGTSAESAPMPRGSGFGAGQYRMHRYTARDADSREPRDKNTEQVFRIGF